MLCVLDQEKQASVVINRRTNGDHTLQLLLLRCCKSSPPPSAWWSPSPQDYGRTTYIHTGLGNERAASCCIPVMSIQVWNEKQGQFLTQFQSYQMSYTQCTRTLLYVVVRSPCSYCSYFTTTPHPAVDVYEIYYAYIHVHVVGNRQRRTTPTHSSLYVLHRK